MSIIAGFMVPHPPLIIPEIGRGQEKQIQETVDAYEEVGRQIGALVPETIVILSPHNVMYSDYFHIRPGKHFSGSFHSFGAGSINIRIDADEMFAEWLSTEAEKKELPWGMLGARNEALDHGTLVPLYFIRKYYRDFKLVSLGLSGLSLPMHYMLGQMIQRASESLDRRTVIIASGDLSHYLKEEGPYGFRKEGPQYDERIMDVMADAAFGRLLEFSEDFCHQAGECGHRAFTILAGAFDRTEVKAERLSYQGVFGVGYGICTYEAVRKDPSRDFLDQYKATRQTEHPPMGVEEDPYVSLARRSLEMYVRSGIYMDVPEGLPGEMLSERAGAFVSIHKGGQLRGCIGTIGPVRENLAREIIENAVSAGTRDPRFPAIEVGELPYLDFSVDVLGKPEKIDSIHQLDVKEYGVIVSKGGRRGLLLPDLEGVDTPQQQVAIAAQKAGLRPDEKGLHLERFRVIRHGEKS